MIWDEYQNTATDGEEVEWAEPVTNTTEEFEWAIAFVKIWLEESGQGLLLTGFSDSWGEIYAETKAYNTSTADPDSVMEFTLTRP
jgi:hypothetical protein